MRKFEEIREKILEEIIQNEVSLGGSPTINVTLAGAILIHVDCIPQRDTVSLAVFEVLLPFVNHALFNNLGGISGHSLKMVSPHTSAPLYERQKSIWSLLSTTWLWATKINSTARCWDIFHQNLASVQNPCHWYLENQTSLVPLICGKTMFKVCV